MYLAIQTHTLPELWTSDITVQSQKTEIFQVGERNIKNQKVLDNSGNVKMGWPRDY